jgi:DNA (cytosine-5)-methyltransferase 1
MLTVGSLFSGIGGFELGLERAGMRVIWQAEIDPYASAVLKKHWPNVPNYGDVRSIRAGAIERPDVICGGFPCQDISLAGRGGGIEGERSGLWREYARIMGDLRPRFAIVENVGALTSRGLAAILGDLAALGYDAEWHVIPAAAVNAPHIRERCWIIADAYGYGIRDDQQRPARRRDDIRDGRQGLALDNGSARIATDADRGRCEVEREPEHGGERGAPWHKPNGLGEEGRRSGPALSDASGERIQGDRPARQQITFAPALARLLGRDDAGGYWRDWPTIAPLRRVNDGASGRMDRARLRCLGNAVVPQIAEILGRAIIECSI